MFADMVLSHGTVRFVAAYAPHSGYSRDVLNQIYEGLHACLEDARGRRFQLVVGAGFNTQLNTGFRGTLLQDVVATFGLTITNDDDNHTFNVDTWTFEGPCGLRRRIDFIMCNQEMRFTSAHATCNLDLGSDHRAVTVSFDLSVRRRKNRKCFPLRTATENLHWINKVCPRLTMQFCRTNLAWKNLPHCMGLRMCCNSRFVGSTLHWNCRSKGQCRRMMFYKTSSNHAEQHMTVLKEQICPN